MDKTPIMDFCKLDNLPSLTLRGGQKYSLILQGGQNPLTHFAKLMLIICLSDYFYVLYKLCVSVFVLFCCLSVIII